MGFLRIKVEKNCRHDEERKKGKKIIDLRYQKFSQKKKILKK